MKLPISARVRSSRHAVGPVGVVRRGSPRMFWPWVSFCVPLARRGGLDPLETELVILRTVWNCGNSGQWRHYSDTSRSPRVSAQTVARVAEGPANGEWSDRHRVLLTAVDELCAERMISGSTWADLRTFLDERQLTAVCLLTGNYAMLAMTLNTIAVGRNTLDDDGADDFAEAEGGSWHGPTGRRS